MSQGANELKQISRGAIIASAGLFVSQYLLSPLIGILNTRILGAHQYGLFSLASGIIAIFASFPLMGMHDGMIKFLPSYLSAGEISKVKGLFFFAWRVLSAVGALFVVLCVLSTRHVSTVIYDEPEMQVILYSVAIVVLLNNYQYLFASLFASLRDITRRTLIKYIYPNVTKLIILIAVFFLNAGLPGVIAAVLASALMQVAMGFVYSRRLFPALYDREIPANFTAPDKKAFMAFSLPLYMTLFVDILFQQTDGLMIGYFSDAKHVGIYEVAFRVTPFILFPMGGMSQVFQPILSESFATGQLRKVGELYRSVTKIVTMLTVPILISILTFAEELLSIFGPEFRQGASCLMILSVGFFVQAATGHTTALVVLSGRPRWLLMNNTAAMLVNILLNYILIQKYNIIGAALATAISISLSNLAQLAMVYRLLGFHPYTASYWKIILAAAAGGSVFVGLKSAQVTSPWAFLVFICVGISIYFFLLWKIGLDEQEKMLVQAFQRKLKSLVGMRGQ